MWGGYWKQEGSRRVLNEDSRRKHVGLAPVLECGWLQLSHGPEAGEDACRHAALSDLQERLERLEINAHDESKQYKGYLKSALVRRIHDGRTPFKYVSEASRGFQSVRSPFGTTRTMATGAPVSRCNTARALS